MKALTPAALTRATGLFAYSALPSPRPTLNSPGLPFRPQPRDPSDSRFLSRLSAIGHSKASPLSSRLATGSRRNRFVLLQTGSPPPVAPHDASRRRSYFRLQSYDLL